MDADGQHLPDDMEKLLMKAAAEPMALIVGSRTIDRNVPWNPGWKFDHPKNISDENRSGGVRYHRPGLGLFDETS